MLRQTFTFFVSSPLSLAQLCKNRHGGTTLPLVDFRWISSFIGLTLSSSQITWFFLSPFVSLPLLSVLVFLSLVGLLLFPFTHRESSLFKSLPPLCFSTISRRCPPSRATLDEFWARQESLCNWHHSARVTGTKCFWYGPVGRKVTGPQENRREIDFSLDAASGVASAN